MRRITAAATGIFGLSVTAMLLSVAARRAQRINLRGRVAVVTGGGRGLGLAITRELAAHGCRLAICGRDADVIHRAVQALRAEGAEIFGAPCDASEPEQVEAFITSVIDRYEVIDVLVNNAGQCFVGPAVELEPADLESALRNIFWTHYYPTLSVLPHMRQRSFGRIANITSIGGKLPLPHQSAYVAAKHAATGWSETLAVELPPEGIRVSTITPPPLRDGAPLHVHFNGRVEDELKWFTRALTSPLTAISASRTARVVVDAVIHGDGERAVSVGSWLAARAQGLAPNAMARLLQSLHRGLPPAARATSRMQLGSEVAAASRDETVRRLARRASADEARYLPANAPPAEHRDAQR